MKKKDFEIEAIILIEWNNWFLINDHVIMFSCGSFSLFCPHIVIVVLVLRSSSSFFFHF